MTQKKYYKYYLRLLSFIYISGTCSGRLKLDPVVI